jgi:hypothetical protein
VTSHCRRPNRIAFEKRPDLSCIAGRSDLADRQADGKPADTEAMMAILEDKRAEVMSREPAGCFIREWQETGDHVRQSLFQDARCQAIKSKGRDEPYVFEHEKWRLIKS